jgi:hypothetical protein
LLDYTQESLNKTTTLAEELEHLENYTKTQAGEKTRLEQQLAGSQKMLQEQMEINAALKNQVKSECAGGRVGG